MELAKPGIIEIDSNDDMVTTNMHDEDYLWLIRPNTPFKFEYDDNIVNSSYKSVITNRKNIICAF